MKLLGYIFPANRWAVQSKSVRPARLVQNRAGDVRHEQDEVLYHETKWYRFKWLARLNAPKYWQRIDGELWFTHSYITDTKRKGSLVETLPEGEELE